MEGVSAKEAFGKVCCLSDVSVCLPEQVYMHYMSVVAHRGKKKKKVLNPLELELQTVMSCTLWVLGTEP